MSWLRAFQLASAAVVAVGLVAPAAAAPSQRKSTMGKRSEARNVAAESAQGTRRGSAKHRKSDLRVAPPVCAVPSIAFDRGLGSEIRQITLVDCQGEAAAPGQRDLSIMARLRGSPIPTIEKNRVVAAPGSAPRKGELSRGVKLVDAGLLQRLHKISAHFGAKPVSVISGYRPQSTGSLHQHAKALDIRIRGVANTELVAFCRSLPDTGCGYYPNSTFVHVDVRKKGTGNVSWIDASGPGEPARYVKQWPPPEGETTKSAAKSPGKKATPPKNPPTQTPPSPAKHTQPPPETKVRAG